MRLFNEIDHAKTGKLTRQQFVPFIRQLASSVLKKNSITKEQAELMFTALDEDKSEAIEKKEIVKFKQKMEENKQKQKDGSDDTEDSDDVEGHFVNILFDKTSKASEAYKAFDEKYMKEEEKETMEPFFKGLKFH